MERVTSASMAGASLSLHQLTALELSPLQLIDLAAQLRCTHVGLFTCLPPGIATQFPCLTDDDEVQAAVQRLQATGVQVNNAEVFALRDDIDLAHYCLPLQRAARLGARMATVHVHEACPQRAAELYRQFCQMAGDQGLRAALEFTSFSACRTLGAALRLVEHVLHPAACLAIDALHFFRSGGCPQQLAGIPREWLGYLQLCDGLRETPADPYREAVQHRLLPAEGEFLLVQMLEQIGPHLIVDVEVPRQEEQNNGLSAQLRAERAVSAARTIMRQAAWC